MSLSAALVLADQGFHVFPLVAGGKLPATTDFANNCTRDPARIRAMFYDDLFKRDHGYNVGIYCGKFGDDPAHSLIAIDVDNKDGKNGSQHLAPLAPALGLTSTYTQQTPTGGFHVVYRSSAPVGSSVGGVGRTQWPSGLDIRGRGGFIVGAGSTTEKGSYIVAAAMPLADASDALRAKCAPYVPPRDAASNEVPDGIDEQAARRRIEHYLSAAPLAVQGSGGDATTFHVCCAVKDQGVSEAVALELLLTNWNDRCAPPWEASDLQTKVANAYRFGRNAPGCAAPDHLFKPMQTYAATNAQAGIVALAALSRVEYELRRKDEAKRLAIRESVLDELVAAARPVQEDATAAEMFPPVQPWPLPVVAADVLAEVRQLFRDYLVCDEPSRCALTLWAVWTWLVDTGDCAPILAVLSPEPRCGKSTALGLLTRLVYRPLAVANVSSAALFRAVEAWRPTLLIDEVDSFLKDNEELRGIINSGHTRDTAFVLRTVGDDHTPKRFTTWGAKAVAGIGKLPRTIADRAIVVPLRRKLAADHCMRLVSSERFPDVVRRVARLAADAVPAIAAHTPAVPDALNDRQADGWRSLLALADYAGGEWPALARQMAITVSGGDVSATESYGTMLLRDVRAVFDDRKTDRLSSVDLLTELNGDAELPWGDLMAGKPMNERRLAVMLKSYGVKAKSLRGTGHPGLPRSKPLRGYSREMFNEAWSRYLPTETHTPAPHPLFYP